MKPLLACYLSFILTASCAQQTPPKALSIIPTDVPTLTATEASCASLNALNTQSAPVLLLTDDPLTTYLLAYGRMTEIQIEGPDNGVAADGTIAWGNCDIDAQNGQFGQATWVSQQPISNW